MAAVTGPSPTKSALKKMNVDLAAKNDALTALSADLQSAVDRKVSAVLHSSTIKATLIQLCTRSSDFSFDFSWIFLFFFLPYFL